MFPPMKKTHDVPPRAPMFHVYQYFPYPKSPTERLDGEGDLQAETPFPSKFLQHFPSHCPLPGDGKFKRGFIKGEHSESPICQSLHKTEAPLFRGQNPYRHIHLPPQNGIQELPRLARCILEVGVQKEDYVALALSKSDLHRGALAEIAREFYDLRSRLPCLPESGIAGAIVDDDNLIAERKDAPDRPSDPPFFVISGNYRGNPHRSNFLGPQILGGPLS